MDRPPPRIARGTPRGLAVILVAAAWAAAGSPEAALAGGGGPATDLGRDLRVAERGDLPLSERLAAAGQVLATGDLPKEHGEAALRAALSLLPKAADPGAWLLLRALDSYPFSSEQRGEALRRLDPLREAGSASASDRARLAAVSFLLGDRSEGGALAMTGVWPPEAFVEAVLRREGASAPGPHAPGPADEPDPAEGASRLRALLPALRALDAASDPEAAQARRGLDELLRLGKDAFPTLLHEAAAGARGVGAGRLVRATRAILVLGMGGDRRATPTLVACLEAPSGWVRVAAATALGDLGDPAAAVALCRQLVYRGDVFRPRDAWEYPGAGEISIPPEQWNDVEYFATDCAVADALLRMGIRNAAGWLLRNKMDPSKASFRVRVLQDATDALRRSVPSMPVGEFLPDAGIPARKAALQRLRAWWDAHRRDPGLTPTTFPEADPGFREAARSLADALAGAKVLDLLIAQESAALLGPALTPTLVEALQGSPSRLHRGEIARALGAVEDPRARPALLRLLSDATPSVRSVAAESLTDHLEGGPEVEAALVALLDDPVSGPRVSALKALTAAPRSASVLAALRAHPASRHEAATGAGEDREYRIAERVALLVQEGDAHWPPVLAGLRERERYVRRQWWDLLRRALRAPEETYDPLPDPGGPGWRAPDEAALQKALAARRGA